MVALDSSNAGSMFWSNGHTDVYQALKLIFYHSLIRIFPYYYYWGCDEPVQSLVV